MNGLKRLFPEDPARLTLREHMLSECRKRVAQGTPLQDLIVPLKEAGLSIVESMWVIAQLSGLDLAQVKDLTTSHPIWRETVEAAQPLHDELERAAHTPL